MHANLWPGPQFKQRFEFGALEVRGSSWATDWLHTVRGLNELAHTAGAPYGAPASVPCRSKENKSGKPKQHLNAAGSWTPTRQMEPPAAAGRVVPLDSLRSSSFHNPPSGDSTKHSKDEKSGIEENI